MKALLLVSIIILFGVVGFGVSGSYLERKRFFFSLLEFLKIAKNQVGFSSKKLTYILDEAKSIGDKNFSILLNNYGEILGGNLEFDKAKLFDGITILTDEEKQCIYLFFKKLGMTDVFTQIDEIDATADKAQMYFSLASEEAKKYGMLYTKLGLIVGAFVALIII